MNLKELSNFERSLIDVGPIQANIYVIDDSQDIQNLFSAYLKPEKDFKLKNYVDEMQLLSDLYNQKIDRPDLIVIDINLSKLDGELLHQMIKEFYGEKVPVAYISGNQFRSDVETPFFKKPLQKMDVKNMLKIAYERAA